LPSSGVETTQVLPRLELKVLEAKVNGDNGPVKVQYASEPVSHCALGLLRPEYRLGRRLR